MFVYENLYTVIEHHIRAAIIFSLNVFEMHYVIISGYLISKTTPVPGMFEILAIPKKALVRIHCLQQRRSVV